MRIFVTGACGYKGSVLIPKLLDEGHEITACDVMWFGNKLKKHSNLKVLQADIREREINLEGFDCIIHLASVANDPCADFNPALTWEISCLATQQLMDNAYRTGVKNFIYASSGSVYGVKDEDHITEELTLNPISAYNKTKMVAERVLLSYADKMRVVSVRPATVCGLSSRMRLDVAVNLLTMQALTKKKITVLGGSQVRPNIHILDIASVYSFFLRNNHLSGIYNAGFENISILEIAKIIQSQIDCEIVIEESNDPRSYRMNSDKLLDAGFVPRFSVQHAIQEIKNAFEIGALEDKDEYYNLNWMKAKGIS